MCLYLAYWHMGTPIFTSNEQVLTLVHITLGLTPPYFAELELFRLADKNHLYVFPSFVPPRASHDPQLLDL